MHQTKCAIKIASYTWIVIFALLTGRCWSLVAHAHDDMHALRQIILYCHWLMRSSHCLYVNLK